MATIMNQLCKIAEGYGLDDYGADISDALMCDLYNVMFSTNIKGTTLHVRETMELIRKLGVELNIRYQSVAYNVAKIAEDLGHNFIPNQIGDNARNTMVIERCLITATTHLLEFKPTHFNPDDYDYIMTKLDTGYTTGLDTKRALVHMIMGFDVDDDVVLPIEKVQAFKEDMTKRIRNYGDSMAAHVEENNLDMFEATSKALAVSCNIVRMCNQYLEACK